MAKTIDQLPAASALTGTETLALNQAGATKKVTAATIAGQAVATYANFSTFPVTGKTNTVYIATDNGGVWYWNGSAYTQTGSPLPEATTAGQVPTYNGSSYVAKEPAWRVFNVVDYGANPNNDADDTAGIQAAINACVAAGGGVVYFPFPRNDDGYHYYVDGPLITSLSGSNPNCQLYIPFVLGSEKQISITLEGEAYTSGQTEGIALAARNTNGVIIESRIDGTGTTPSVFSTPYGANPPFPDRNYIHVHFDKIEVRTKSKDGGGTDIVGTMSAINFARLTQFTYGWVKVSIQSNLANSVFPSNPTYGIIMPDVNNKALLGGDFAFVEGYQLGYVTAEHDVVNRLVAAGCVYGLAVRDGFHAVSIQHYTAEVNMYQIALFGTMSHVSIFNYETEHYAGPEWYSFQSDIRREGGNTRLRIFTANVVKSGIGYVNEMIVTGSPNYRIFNGAGTTVYYPPFPTPSLGFEDNFNRADSTSLGNLVSPVTPWLGSGTIGIDNNQAYCVNEGSGGATTANTAIVDIGESNFTMILEVELNGVTSDAGFVFEYVDENNFVAVEISTGAVGLIKKVSGVLSAQGAPLTNGSNFGLNEWKIVKSGTSVEVFRGGEYIGTLTDAIIGTGHTKAGFYILTGSSFTDIARVDNFSC